MSDDKKENATVRTWGYHATEDAKIFELEEGKKLPKGWYDTPTHEAILKEQAEAAELAAMEAEEAARDAEAERKALEDERAAFEAEKAAFEAEKAKK